MAKNGQFGPGEPPLSSSIQPVIEKQMANSTLTPYQSPLSPYPISIATTTPGPTMKEKLYQLNKNL